MVKILHYIKEDYSSEFDRFCLKKYKEIYPDYEFMAWRPGSSPLRILYDNGGLFLGYGIIPRRALPKETFDKPFVVFDNRFESVDISFDICYSEKENPIFLELMEKGILESFKKRGFDNSNKIGLAEKELDLGDIKILDRFVLGFDKGYYEFYDSPFLDTNVRYNSANDFFLHYMTIDKNTRPNTLFAIVDSFNKGDYKGDKHFLLIVNDGADIDLISRMGALLVYTTGNPKKSFDIINLEGADNIDKILIEYIGRRFNGLRSCERVL